MRACSSPVSSGGTNFHACLQAWLRGLTCPVVSEDTFAEYERVLSKVRAKERFDTEFEPCLDTMRSSALWVTPVRLREPVCRDRHDDKFIEAVLAAGARTLVARDADLTVLLLRCQIMRAGLQRLVKGLLRDVQAAHSFGDWVELQVLGPQR